MKSTTLDPNTTQRPATTRDELLWMLVGFLVGLAIWLGTNNLAAGIGVAMALGLGLSAHERSTRRGDGPDLRRATRT